MIRRRRLGLRARVTLIYALGALLLTSTVAASSLVLTQRRLLSETEATARSQLYRNVLDLRRGLQALPEIPDDLPGSASTATEADPEVALDDDATTTTRRSTSTTQATVPTTERPAPEVTVADGAATESPTTTSALDLIIDITDLIPDPDEAIDVPGPVRGAGVDAPETTTPFGNSFGPPTTPPPEEPVEPEPGPTDPITSILSSLDRPNGALGLLVVPPDSVGGVQREFSLSGQVSSGLPRSLVELVGFGAVSQRYDDPTGEPRLALGIQIPEFDAQYFEVVPLTELQSTLDSLRNILFGVALAASAAGAGLGYYSAYRAVQPLNRVSAAAQAISEGDFDTRLDDQIDPDLVRLTTSFNHMVEALERRIRRDEQFASDVSHELRSPLMTLTASVGVLEGRRADLPAPAQQAVDLLTKDLRRFQRLVEDLLEISRMDVGAVRPDMTPVFLREFLQFVIAQSVSPTIPVTCAADDLGLLVQVDKRRMAQAVTNLIDNAEKYAGGATSVTYAREGGHVHVYVDDDGPGVPPEDRIRIFDRFTRAGSDAGRRDVAKGVGLGLSLVSEHIRLHGGRVWVTDRPGGRAGARFVIELPIDDTVMAEEEMAT